MSIATLTESTARKLVIDVLVAYGTGTQDARVVSDHLVDAELAGVKSHGLLRVPQYVDEILGGQIDPGASPTLVRRDAARVEVEGNRCFGQVACTIALEEGLKLARAGGLGLVTIREAGHAGRIGAYAESLGREGFISMIFCSGPRSGHRVAPFNGREGRLATNPIAFSIPTPNDPIVGDFSTASAPEGRIRHLRNIGQPAPPDTLLDADGKPTTDPDALYGDHPGSILPLGGFRLGHRGFALGLLVEAVATLLPGDDSDDASRIGNNVAMIIVGVDTEFPSRAQHMAEYVLSSAPRGDSSVVLPGAPEQQHRASSHAIQVDESTWQAILTRAAARNVSVSGF